MKRDLEAEKAHREALSQGSGASLHGRAHALEEAFFAKREREVLEKFREKIEHDRELGDLLQQCGIRDTAKGEALLACGIRAATVPALIMTPLVVVAWADGAMEDYEREALVRNAVKHRIKPGSEAWQLLESWLSSAPPAGLFDAWIEYAKELAAAMPVADRRAFAAEIIEMAEDIDREQRTHHRFNVAGRVGEVRVLDRVKRIFEEVERSALSATGRGR